MCQPAATLSARTRARTSGNPSCLDTLFAPHRRVGARCRVRQTRAREAKWVIEKSASLENPESVVRLLELCQRCPVRRECLLDALGEDAFTVIGCWGGTMMSERLPAMRRIAETLIEASPMTFQNAYGTPTSSLIDAAAHEPRGSDRSSPKRSPTLSTSWRRWSERIEWWRDEGQTVAAARADAADSEYWGRRWPHHAPGPAPRHGARSGQRSVP